MKSLFVSVSEFPVVTVYAGRLVATEGCAVTWPSECLEGERLAPRAHAAYEVLLSAGSASASSGFHDTGIGHSAFVCPTSLGPIAIACIPSDWLNGRTLHRKRVRRFARYAERLAMMLHEGAASHYLSGAVTHGVVNANTQIRGAVDAMLCGSDVSDKPLRDIEKGCSLITATLESAQVLSPRWKPTLDCEFNRIHPAVFAVRKRWEPELNDRRIFVELREGYAQVRIDADLLSVVLDNALSNIVKYGKADERVCVHFHDRTDGGLDVVFDMISRRLSQDDVSRVFAIGERVESHGGAGQGLGLALVKRVMEAYGGGVTLTAGSPLSSDILYARNALILHFAAARVRRLASPPAHG